MEKAYLITQNTDLEKDFSEYDRLYIGDQYCEHNMFYFFNDKKFLEKIKKLNKKITITTPIISENGIMIFFDFLNYFLKNIDNKIEVVINDLGVFYKLKKDYPLIKIIWGNFLSGQNKDPYLKVFKDKKEHKNLTIDSIFYKDLFSKEKIGSIELYNVFQGINIDKNFNINLYYPYVVYSINRYCSNALINQNIDYLKIIEKCKGCKNIEKNLEMELKIGEEDITQYYRGNKQFYKNEKLSKNKNMVRIIYNYDLI